MSDRELLEMAAKAAGIDVGPDDFCDPIDRKYSEGLGLWVRTGYADIGRWFNPLDDGSEALRLAVTLHMDIEVGYGYTRAIADGGIATETHGGAFDENSATRRAIVRAAAEIGKAMP